jgi:hypothetical protein
MVGTSGFEPPTPRTPSVCATRLRHVPTRKAIIIAEKVFIIKYEIGFIFSPGYSQFLGVVPEREKEFFSDGQDGQQPLFLARILLRFSSWLRLR